MIMSMVNICMLNISSVSIAIYGYAHVSILTLAFRWQPPCAWEFNMTHDYFEVIWG